MVLLIVIADGYVTSKADCTAVGRKELVYDFQDGGFSRAVVSDHGHMLPLFQFKGEPVKEGERSEGFGQAFYLQNVVSALKFGLQFQMHVGAHFDGFFQRLYFIKHFFSAFRPLDGFFPIKGF